MLRSAASPRGSPNIGRLLTGASYSRPILRDNAGGVPKLLPAINLRIGRVMITRTQGISDRHRYLTTLFGSVCATAIFAAPLAWTQLDAPLAHAAPGDPYCNPLILGCPGYIPPSPPCPVSAPTCPGYIPPAQPNNNITTPPGQLDYDHGGKPGGKPGKPGDPGKPGSGGAGGHMNQSSPPAAGTNAPDRSGPAPDGSGHAPAAPPPPASAAPPAPAPSAPAPVMSAPAPVMSAPAPAISMPAPAISMPAPAISTPSK